MRNFKEHLIQEGTTIKEALLKLDELASDAVLFVINRENRLVGSLTDGDVRRGLIKGIAIDEPVDAVIQKNPKYFEKGLPDFDRIIEYRQNNFRIVPVIDEEKRVVNIVNFGSLRSYLPVDAVIMAGGKGSRLRPLTESIPKPLLKVGQKPIMEHNMDRLILYGIDDFWISIKYLGQQIVNYFGNGASKNIKIGYITEESPLGTLGAVSKISDFKHDTVLVTNSDILTNLDYERFYLDFISKGADMSVATIPYDVNVPYAVLETNNGHILSLKEKPTYTYFSNAGIYMVKREVLERVPKDEQYNATDLIENLITEGRKVISHPILGYWLDVGKPEDFKKAQADINQIRF
ncbi:nucleotidyltransferase family protein [Flagellimonas sp. 2504JD1-5]